MRILCRRALAWPRPGAAWAAATKPASKPTLALQQHPDEAEAHIEMAVMLGLDRHYAEAVQHLSKAVAKAPDHPTAYQQLAACLALMGQHKAGHRGVPTGTAG